MTAKAVFSGMLPKKKLQKPALRIRLVLCILAAGTGSGANSNQQQSYLDPTGLTLGVTGSAEM